MNRFTDMLLIVLRLLLVFVIILGLYGWFWFPPFQNGTASGPFWLITVYDTVIPFVIRGALIGIVLIGVYRFFVFLWPGAKPSATVSAFWTLLLALICLSLFGGLPSFSAEYEHLETSDFANQNYRLVLRQNSSAASYMVFECNDPIGFWCRRVLQTSNMDPLPTPIPAEELEPVIIEQDGQQFEIQPTPLPTMTPPVRFVKDSTGELELSLQIGNMRQVITTTMITSETLRALEPTPAAGEDE